MTNEEEGGKIGLQSKQEIREFVEGYQGYEERINKEMRVILLSLFWLQFWADRTVRPTVAEINPPKVFRQTQSLDFRSEPVVLFASRVQPARAMA